MDRAIKWLIRLLSQRDHRPKCTAMLEDLGLGQVERIFALDITAANVVADGIAHDLHRRIQHEGELRLRHIPMTVAAETDPVVRTNDLLRQRFEKELWTLSLIDSDIDILGDR